MKVNFASIRIRHGDTLWMLIILMIAFVSSLFGEGQRGQGNLMIVDVDNELNVKRSMVVKVDGVLLADKGAGIFEALISHIASCERLVVMHNGSIYMAEERDLLEKIQARRDKDAKGEATYFVDASKVGGKGQVGVAVSFSDKIGNGIIFNKGIIRHESEIDKLLKAADAAGVRKILWIPEDTPLSNRFGEVLKRDKIIVLAAKPKPDLHGVTVK